MKVYIYLAAHLNNSLPAWTFTSVNIIPFDNFVIRPSYMLGELIFVENVEKYGKPTE